MDQEDRCRDTGKLYVGKKGNVVGEHPGKAEKQDHWHACMNRKLDIPPVYWEENV